MMANDGDGDARLSLGDLGVILGLCALCFGITLAVGDKSYDDAYITFRYARNLSSGRGFAYNPGDSFLGTTTPLLTLSLAALGRLYSAESIPRVAQWLTGISLLGCSVFTYLLARDDGKRFGGGVSALFIATNPLLITGVWGGEALLLIALALGALFLYLRGLPIASGVLLGLAFLTRAEGILPALLLGAHFVHGNRRFPWRLASAFVATTLPWTLYSLHTFGALVPATLRAKQAQLESGYLPPFFTTSLRWLAAYVFHDPSLALPSSRSNVVILVLAAIGGGSLLRNRRFRFSFVALWLGLYSLSYEALGVPFYLWYAAPLVVGGLILAGLGAQTLWVSVSKRWRVALLVSLCLPLAAAARNISLYARSSSHVQRLYTSAGLWLRDNTPLDATVGYFEIGWIGYYSEREIVDPVGLTHRDVPEHVARGDVKWAYRRYEPDYLIVNPVRWYDRLGSIRDEPWFSREYVEATRIEEPGYFDSPLVIYERVHARAPSSQPP